MKFIKLTTTWHKIVNMQDVHTELDVLISVSKIVSVTDYPCLQGTGVNSSVVVDHINGVEIYNCVETVKEIADLINKLG